MTTPDNSNDLRVEIERLTQQLRQAAGAQHEAERAKTEYMQNVAHQLAAPINAIKMNIETLKNPKVSFERRKTLLSSIYSQGTILVHLIKNFSLMSHLEGDHNLDSFREKPEDVDLCSLCINFSSDFQPIAAHKDQTIRVVDNEFDQCGRPKVWVIKNLFSQVIYNLLENATKYADADSHITIGMRRDTSFFSITVTSYGTPINPNDSRRIFDRGIRGDSAKSLHPAGTGFGLYIARRIVEIHKGKIEIEAQGKKSTFVVSCPKQKPL